MMEFVHAHATYRFVISDEEEERPRLLVKRFFRPLPRILADLFPDMAVQTEHTNCLYNTQAICFA
jgi:hypothetical protein